MTSHRRPPAKPSPTEKVVRITHLRGCLGIAYHHVVNTEEPVVIKRYSRADVALVPLWEWRFLKDMEASIRAGKRPWENS